MNMNPAPLPLDLLAEIAAPLLWRARAKGFYTKEITDLLALRGVTFSELTVTDLQGLVSSAASKHADILALELQLPGARIISNS